ncbi:porin family protein [Granulicella cerasi]|uniref:Porin family protein n=1 Tax=Granulicella cerasi TaxID=741063 RepID=A0ABW1Z4F8_9BACT|nr:porin family protein [Granulicella cerasi]
MILFSGHAWGQASVYGEFSAGRLGSNAPLEWLYGGTVGVNMQITSLGRRALFLGDVQARGGWHNGTSLTSISIGPRVAFPLRGAITPYAGFQVGIGRFSAPANIHTTDSLYGFNGGVQKRLRSHLDAVVDYSWTQLNYNFQQYAPQTVSAGLVWQFSDNAGFDRKKPTKRKRR